MLDPWTSRPSPPAPEPPLGGPLLADGIQARDPVAAAGVLGHRVLSASGEDLGVVVGVENGRDGRPKKLCFLEPDDGPLREVPLRFVRAIDARGIHLKGPRDGYHITRVGGLGPRVMLDPRDEE